MLMRGRWGLLVNWSCRSFGSMRSGETPGKFLLKKWKRSVPGDWERSAK